MQVEEYGALKSKVMEGGRMVSQGDRAPDFTTVDHTGKEFSLADMRGKKVWLWFYSSPGGGN
jgi:peroxiredoxin